MMLILENGAVVPRRLRRKTEARFDAFIAAGGNGRFVQLPAFEDNGHGSFTRNPAACKCSACIPA